MSNKKVERTKVESVTNKAYQVGLILVLAGYVEMIANGIFTILLAIRFQMAGNPVSLGSMWEFYDMMVRLPMLAESIVSPLTEWMSIVAIIVSYAISVAIVYAFVRLVETRWTIREL